MRKRSGLVLTVVAAGAIWLGGLAPAIAQGATPIVPDPSECVVQPRSDDEIVDLYLNGDHVPDPDIAAGSFPTGDPAPADAVERINATLRQFTACSNNDDIPRMLALTTDNGAQYFLDFDSSVTEEQLREMAAIPATPVAEADRESFHPMTGLVVLDDGRVGGLSGDDGTVYLIFKDVDGVWLIDEIVGIAPSTATPAA